MNDIEKLFKEKLAQHPVAPPPGVWEQLQQAQAAKQQKGGWWWVAASVALLFSLGSIFLLNHRPDSSTDRVAIELDFAESQQPLAQLPPVPSVKKEAVVEKQAVYEQPERISRPDVMERNLEPEQAIEPIVPSVTLAKIEPTVPGEGTFQLSGPVLTEALPELAIAQVSMPERQSITIIYKSGSKEKTESKKPLEKAFAFLAQVKEGEVGFSELRSAKSEIIAKAFSSKPEPMLSE
ncbi:MAG: hypothetical protein AAF632_11315 [Bacteroidota bacterium]